MNGVLNHSGNTTNNLNNNITNGPSKAVHYQQDMDAIVPASDPDDNTDEEEEYSSYMQEQEQQQQFEKHNLGLTRQSQNQYNSTRDQEHEEDYAAHQYRQQQQQQQPHHHQHQQLQQIQQQYQLQQQQQLQAYRTQAMNIQQLLRQDHSQDQDMSGADSHEEEEYYQQNPQYDPRRQHQIDIDMLHQHDDEDDDDDFDDDDEIDEDQAEEEMMDEDGEEGSEVMSLTEEDIDFNLVYAFHTFVATQEGQASVVRNDALMLLEDVNVYWWLVRVLKTGVIGYIPAENIETPFERLARLNTYRNVALSAPSPEWGTFDQHIQPLDPAILEQRALNRRSVIFRAQNDFLEASETEWTEEEDEDGEWYDDGEEDEDEEEEDLEADDLQELEGVDDDDFDDEEPHDAEDVTQKTPLQLEAERVQQEILNDQKKLKSIVASQTSANKGNDGDEASNRYRKPLLDEDDLFSNTEPRVISLTPAIARDESTAGRVQNPPGKARNLRLSDDALTQRSQSPQQQQQQSQQSQRAGHRPPISPTTGLRPPSLDSEDEEPEKSKKIKEERTEAKLSSILGKNQENIVRKTKEEYEEGLPPEAVVVKKPGKFKSLFGVGRSSKDKERKEKEKQEKQEKERLKNLAKSSAATTKTPAPARNSIIGAKTSSGSSGNSGISSNLFRPRSNSSGSVGPSSSNTPQSSSDSPQQEIITLRVYPGNVDFGASMYKTVVVTPSTMASEVTHQAVIKFRLAPDGTASTGDFFLTVKGVDGDETVLQPTDKPMAIYQSLTAHLTTPLPANHRLSISSVSSMMSVNSIGSQNSSNNNLPTSSGQQGLRRTGSGKAEPQQRSIRFLLNKRIRRAGSVLNSSLPSTPTTPTAPQEDFFWVKVVCQAQDLPQSMLLLEGMGTAMDKSDPRVLGQSVATKVEHWIPMHSTSNAGDVIFKAIEKVGIRAGVVDGVPEHVLMAKRATVLNGLVIEYQLGLKLIGNTSKKHNQGEEIPLPPQLPLVKCFEDNQLAPVRRSPKADVASMPPHPDHVFFLRKATKSLQAEMRLVQEQLQLSQQQQPRKVPSPLNAQQLRITDSDTSSSAQPSPTNSALGVISPSSPGPQNRNFNAASAALMNASRLTGGSGAGSPQIPRRKDSVVVSPASPIRGNSFDGSSGRPSPTLSTQSLMTTHQIHPPQASRTPTPDRHQPQQQVQQTRAASPNFSQGSPASLARPLQAPSPAPSNLSSHADQQEGSRSSTPERPTRPERQRATSPTLTHGPSPLSMSAVMLQNDQTALASGRKGSFASIDELLSSSHHPTRLNMKKNGAQGVDIVLNKGIVRSSRTTNSSNHTQYQYSFVPLEGGEEIDITEIIEDVLGGDSDDEHDDQHLRVQETDQELESMSRKERIAAAVARASQVVAAGKERRKANSGSGSPSRSIRSTKSSSSDRDRLEQLSVSPRGGETLLKLERALAGEVAASSNSGSVDGNHLAKSAASGRNLPSPMSLTSSSPSSPTMNRKMSDLEVHAASTASLGSRPQSPALASSAADHSNGSGVMSGGPSSPSSPTSSFTRAALISSLNSVPNHRGVSSSPSSPSSVVAPHQLPSEARSFSPLPRPLQTPSPSRPRQLSIQTGVTNIPAGGSSSAGTIDSLNGYNSTLNRNDSRSRSISVSVAELTRRSSSPSRVGAHASSVSESAAVTSPNIATPKDPWLLSSDYNTGMQDLLTLVRGGRSSSVSTSAPSSLRGGFTFGKDGRIIQPPSSTSSSPTLPSRQRLLSLQSHSLPSSPPTSNSSLYSSTFKNTTNNKDTQAHDHFTDDTNINYAKMTNDNNNNNKQQQQTNHLTNDYNMLDDRTTIRHDEVDGAADFEPRIWTRTDRRLKDVRSECHPEVFECWRIVDEDLDKVERELDSLLATVKAAIF
ncbi:hypothetical protein BGX21_004587 [Mortierella sp. AD011]|nr:hypothetical protein BGX20_005690 [Mortierella sp. AD010]KAF9400300.1 hypothetical protein BGX21_004587 [Mortierella sp. AD011]